MRGQSFIKGHGTENDFVLLPDGAGSLELSPDMARRICNRKSGVGGDGVLRAVLSVNAPEATSMAAEAQWFMDYRNADGNPAEMCGNGARVFARYLVDAGLAAPGRIPVATRAGVVEAYAERTGPVRVTIGPFAMPDLGSIAVSVDGRTGGWAAMALLLPNPHAVVTVEDLTDAGSLLTPPTVDPPTAFPGGVNVEFVAARGERHVAMRVYERGVGETRSCGTGAAAVAVARAKADGVLPDHGGETVTYTVDVPGGRLEVGVRPDRRVNLTGAAVLVAEGTIDLDAL